MSSVAQLRPKDASAPAAPPTAATPVKPPGSARSLFVVVSHMLRLQRWSPITWGLSLGLSCALVAAIWPSVSESITEAMKSYPESIKEAFSIQQLSSADQYIDVEMLSLIVPLALAFFTIRSVSRPLVGAEENSYLDALLSLPLDRRVLATGSIIATAILLTVILVIVWALTWAAGLAVGAGMELGPWTMGVVNVWPIAFAFGGFALLLCGLLHSHAAVVGVATGTLIGMYLIDLLGKLSPDIEPFRVISAYRYYGSAVQDGFDLSHALGLAAAGMLLAAVGAVFFNFRDIR